MSTSVFIQAFAILIAACGIFLLHAAWRARTNNAARLLSGWTAIGVSIITFASTSHPDKGAALGIVSCVVIALAALIWSYLQAQPRTARVPSERIAESAPLGTKEITKRVAATLLIGPLAGLSALTMATCGFVLLDFIGVEHTINLVIAMFALPLYWAVIAVITAANSHLWRKSVIVFSSLIAPLAILTLTS